MSLCVHLGCPVTGGRKTTLCPLGWPETGGKKMAQPWKPVAGRWRSRGPETGDHVCCRGLSHCPVELDLGFHKSKHTSLSPRHCHRGTSPGKAPGAGTPCHLQISLLHLQHLRISSSLQPHRSHFPSGITGAAAGPGTFAGGISMKVTRSASSWL